MVLAAVASLVPLVIVELRELSWPDPRFRTLALVDLAFVVFFAGELVVRFARAEDKKKFVRENWWEVLGLVPLYAESAAWLRATRAFRLFRVFRAMRALKFAGRVLRESHLGLIVGIASALILTLASAFYLAEHGANPNVHSFGDAVWWALTTTTTVGYGDIVPHTTNGRIIAGTLMATGVAFFGVVASSLTTAIARIGKKDDDTLDALLRRHEDLVLRRERGELDEASFAAALKDLRALHKR